MSFAKGTGEKVSSERYLLTVLFSIGGFVVGIFVAAQLMSASGMPADRKSTVRLIVNLLPFLFGLGSLLLSVKYVLQRPIRSVLTSRKTYDWRRFFFAFGLWFTFQLVFLILGKAGGAPIIFDLSVADFLPLLFVSLILLPIQTAFEDIFFRGVLFQGISRATGKAGISVGIVALLFAWVHMGNPEVGIFGYFAMAYFFISGLFLGLLTHFDDGLELGMGYHFANNFFAVAILTNTWQSIQTHALFTDPTEPQFSWDMWLPLLVLQPAMLYAFYRIYRWKNPLKRILE